MKNKLLFFLILISCVSLFFNLFKKNITPPCFNADEAAFAYSSYSILKTGADEYGNFLPLRLKSFNDNKLPLYSYLSIPFIKVMGLNEVSARTLNDIVALLLPISIFFLAKELFKKNSIAYLSAVFSAISIGFHIIGRQAHEAYLAVLLISLSTLFFLKILKKLSLKNTSFFILFLTLSLFAYQSSRIFAVFFLFYAIIHFFILKPKENKLINRSIFTISIVLTVFLFLLTDLKYSPTRLKNLFLFSNPGLQVKTQEFRIEGGSRVLYNKLSVGLREAFFNHIKYYSPQFLAISGDENTRFGYGELYPITPVEYLFIFIGIYYLIINKEKWRWFLFSLFLVSPLSGSLSWVALSLTRSLFILIPIYLIAAYGIYYFYFSVVKRRKYIGISLIFLEIIFLIYSWNFYLNHYYKRGVVINSMQCGYKKLSNYISKNYYKFNNFYISPEHGQPYIFLLFYNKYDPKTYQKQAKLSNPDIYGFGQVEKFDKFIFTLSGSDDKKNVSLIAYPHDFKDLNQKELLKIKKIKEDKEEIFWIHEVLN